MILRFGFDLGATSVGWAVAGEEGLSAAGVHIFPVGVEDDSFTKSKKEVSKGVARRQNRMAARILKRYKQRRAKLMEVLQKAGIMAPSGISPNLKTYFNDLEKAGLWPLLKKLPQSELYALRHKAINEQVTLSEIAHLLFWLNQRRGFKSSRKAEASEGDKETSEIKQEMAALQNQVAAYRTAMQAESPGINVSLGSYFHSLYGAEFETDHHIAGQLADPKEHIRRRFVPRALYVEEFDLIWAQQAKHYPDILTPELKTEIGDRTIFFQRKLKSAKHLVAKCRFEPKKHVMPKSHPLYQEFRIWQRLADIRITDSGKGVFQKALTADQKQRLAGVLYLSEPGKDGKFARKMSWTTARKILGIEGRESSWNMDGDILANVTNARIADAVSALGMNGTDFLKELGKTGLEALWHKLYCMDDPDILAQNLQEKDGYSEEMAKALSEVNLEADYGSLSHKAAAAILERMQEQDYGYAEACREAGYHHSHTDQTGETMLKAEDLKLHELLKKYNLSLTSPLVRRIMCETLRVTRALLLEYGHPDTITIELARDIQGNSEMRAMARQSNKNREAMRDTLRQFLIDNTHLSRPSRSDLQKFELFLELECPTTDLELLKENGGDYFHKFRDFLDKVKPEALSKYKLWLQCNRISIYTGKPISFSRLWNGEIEVEHIIPYAYCQDNSLVNLSLCEKEINIKKGKRTPLEWLNAENKQLAHEFKTRVEALYKKGTLGKGKYHRLILDPTGNEETDEEGNRTVFNTFRPEHLAATRQAGKLAAKLLFNVCKKQDGIKNPIKVMNGALTALLREEWGLNDILSTREVPEEIAKKNREDHRHHAIDAIVCAVTTQSMVQQVATQAHLRKGKGGLQGARLSIGHLEPSFGSELLYKQAKVLTDNILVSYLKKNRLVSSRKNKYTHRKKNEGVVLQPQTGVFAPRGPLHQESVFGKITHPLENKEMYVKRESVASLLSPAGKAKIEKIVDPVIKEIIKQAVTNKTPEDQIFLPTKTGGQVPIRKVRVAYNENLQPVKNGLRAYVANDSNYALCLYEDDKGNRAERIVPFWEAVKRRLQRIHVFEQQVSEEVGRGKNKTEALCRLRMVLQKNDMVLWNTGNWSREDIALLPVQTVSENLYRVQKLSGGDYLFRHHLASTLKHDSQMLRIRSLENIKCFRVKLSPAGRVVEVLEQL